MRNGKYVLTYCFLITVFQNSNDVQRPNMVRFHLQVTSYSCLFSLAPSLPTPSLSSIYSFPLLQVPTLSLSSFPPSLAPLSPFLSSFQPPSFLSPFHLPPLFILLLEIRDSQNLAKLGLGAQLI